jgi:DNA invertase Pin-like site-specific DNA recombinase
VARKKQSRIFGYARTSTVKQELSLEEQQDRIRARAARIEVEDDGATWTTCFREQESATVVEWKERGQFSALCQEMEDGDTLIVWRLNRIDRRPWRMIAALNYMVERKIRVIALELEFGSQATNWELDLETTHGRVMVMLMALVAEWWLGSMREDVSAALQRLRAQGFSMGTDPPLGHRFERADLPEGETTRRGRRTFRNREVWDEEQCSCIREVWVRRNVFHEDMQDIAIDFSRRNVSTWTGRPWVRRIDEKDRGAEDAAPSKGLTRWDRRKLNAAVDLLDDFLAKGIVPPELRIDEYVIRWAASRLCDPYTLKQMLLGNGGDNGENAE